MTTYITQGRFTQQAIKGLIDKPEDRRDAVDALMRASGFRLIDYYITYGEHDFLVITEGPDEICAGLLAAAAAGMISDLSTSVAYSTADLKAAAEKGAAVLKDFRPAGG